MEFKIWEVFLYRGWQEPDMAYRIGEEKFNSGLWFEEGWTKVFNYNYWFFFHRFLTDVAIDFFFLLGTYVFMVTWYYFSFNVLSLVLYSLILTFLLLLPFGHLCSTPLHFNFSFPYCFILNSSLIDKTWKYLWKNPVWIIISPAVC